MGKYVITKITTGIDGIESPDLLVNVAFKDRISAISYVRMYVEKKGYDIDTGEYDFPVSGNMVVTTNEKGILSEEYQLVELADDWTAEYDKVMKEIEEWTLNLLGRKLSN